MINKSLKCTYSNMSTYHIFIHFYNTLKLWNDEHLITLNINLCVVCLFCIDMLFMIGKSMYKKDNALLQRTSTVTNYDSYKFKNLNFQIL